MATSEKLYKGLSRRSEWAHSDKGGDDEKFNFMHDFCKGLLIDEVPATAATDDDVRRTAADEDELKGEIAEKEKAEKEKEQEEKLQIRMAYEILCTRIKRDCDGQPLLGPEVPGW